MHIIRLILLPSDICLWLHKRRVRCPAKSYSTWWYSMRTSAVTARAPDICDKINDTVQDTGMQCVVPFHIVHRLVCCQLKTLLTVYDNQPTSCRRLDFETFQSGRPFLDSSCTFDAGRACPGYSRGLRPRLAVPKELNFLRLRAIQA